MKSSLYSLVAAFTCLTAVAVATESNSDATKKEEPAAPAPATPAEKPATTPPAAPTTPPAIAATTDPASTAEKKADPTMLPQVEVNKSRITNTDIQINEKQREIDWEKQKTKPTKLDATLNDSKISKALSIFGGSSSDDRANLAKERVQLLEEEKEVLESMKTAQTKEEKAELQQELDLLRQMRHELETTPK